MPEQSTTIDRTDHINEAKDRRVNRFSWRRFGSFLLLLVCIFSASLLISRFYYSANHDEQFRYFPYQWNTQWITTPDKSTKTACFLKTINVDGNIEYAYVAAAADNFFLLKINGVDARLLMQPSVRGTLTNISTTYNALGFDRKRSLAHLYDISGLLKPGRNVIAVFVQTDEEHPALIVQGEVKTSHVQTIATDNSWKCSSIEQRRNGLNWFDTQFDARNWTSAAPFKTENYLPLDGDPDVLKAPASGGYLYSDNPGSLHQALQLQRQINCSYSLDYGWLRIITSSNYDLTINGRVIGSTSIAERYDQDMVELNNRVEVLNRIQPARPSKPYIIYSPNAQNIDCYLLKNVLQKGNNSIVLTLHNDGLLPQRTVPAAFIDGRFSYNNGKIINLASDTQWLVKSGSGIVTPAKTLSNANKRIGKLNTRIAACVDSGYRYFIDIAKYGLLVAVLILIVLTIFGIILRRSESIVSRILSAYTLILPSGIVLITAYIMQLIFAYSPQDQTFTTSVYNHEALILAGIVFLITIVLYVIACIIKNDSKITVIENSSIVERYGYAVAIVLLMAGSFIYYVHGIGVNSIIPDEYVSMLAARGILRHGIPIYENSGIIYPRSTLYHYLLAFWIFINGGQFNAWSTRGLSVIWGIANIPLIYVFGKTLKNRMSGLIAAILFALSPFMLFYFRECRFYTQFTFFTTLTFYFLWVSINNPQNNRYRLYVIISFCATALSQPFALCIVPGIVIVILLSRQLKNWINLPAISCIVLTIVSMAAELIVYLKHGATELPAIDGDTALQLALHSDSLDFLPSVLFVGDEREHLMLGILFFTGLIYLVSQVFSKKTGSYVAGNWKWWNYLYLTGALTIISTVLVASRPAGRYIIHAFPIICLIAACVADGLVNKIYSAIRSVTQLNSYSRLVQYSCAICIMLLLAAEYRPLRTWYASERDVNKNNTMAAKYVASHMLPGDKVMCWSPEVAMIEIGRCDYFWRPIEGSIFKYYGKDGILRERNSAAVVIDNTDKLNRVLSDNKRVWFIISNNNLGRTSGDYNGDMVRTVIDNFDIQYQPFNVNVYLWDAGRNRYRRTIPVSCYGDIGY